jgi:quinol monooxygenase YgiN
MDEKTPTPYVQLAELEIERTLLDAYRSALKEQIEMAIRVEPGVLALHAVAAQDDPAHITVFEVYLDAEAYRAHLQAPHFTRYKMQTERMVKSLRLRRVDPLMMSAKSSILGAGSSEAQATQ